MHKAFHVYEKATPELYAFLSKTVLGTNGAKYQHLDTVKRIEELDNPLHISLIRHKKIIGNITFCRRGKNWYVRYFAFDVLSQSKAKPNQNTGESRLKKDLIQFFNEKISSGEVENFYAYIDPKNVKSHQLATQLGFLKTGALQTQTFSRTRPKKSTRIIELKDRKEIETIVRNKFQKNTFFHLTKYTDHYFLIKNKQNKTIAFLGVNLLQWKFHRLPGNIGHYTIKLLPHIPIIGSIVKTNPFQFIGLDQVWIAKNDPLLFQEIVEGVLHITNHKIGLWWNQNIPLVNSSINWGPAHLFFGKNQVDLYTISQKKPPSITNTYIVSKDFS